MDDILKYEKYDSEDYYLLLGCGETSSEEQIVAEYKARVLDCHPDKHPDDPAATERFSQIQKAKDVLTDHDKRARYDGWRKSGLAVSFAQWCNMGAVQMSMHWASSKTQPSISHPDVHESKEDLKQNKSCPATVVLPSGHNDKTRPDNERTSIHRTSLNMHAFKDTPSELIQKFRNYEI